MNRFERVFERPIPKAEAAAFFVKLKTAGALANEDDVLYAACIEHQAGAQIGESSATARSARLKLAFALMKASEEVSSEVAEHASMPGPSTEEAPELSEYLESERLGRQAEELGAARHYAERLRAAAEQMGLLEEQLRESEQARAHAEEALAGVDAQMQSAGERAHIAEQAAQQNVQAAHAAAAEAMQRAVGSEQRALDRMTEATSAKLHLQTLRARLLELAAEDPGLPETTPAPPTLPSPEAPEPNVAAVPDQQTNESVAASDAQPTPNASESTIPRTGERERQVSIKVGAHPALLGALTGGVGGGALAGLEARGHGPNLDALRARVEATGRAVGKGTGIGGFARAFGLAKDRALLTLGEATEEHPVAATITGGLVGAGAGATLGPRVRASVNEAARHWRGKKDAAVFTRSST